MQSRTADDRHDHLCLHCGRWSRVPGDNLVCPRCHRAGPALHSAAELLGAWGLNAFLEAQGVSEGILEPAWHVHLEPGATRDEIILMLSWSAGDGAATKRQIRKWASAAGFDPVPSFRHTLVDVTDVWTARETYSLTQFQHPAGLYRLIACRIAVYIAVMSTLGDARDTARPKPPEALAYACEWLTRFLAAPPALDPQRLGERFCVRCFHDQPSYFEPMCSYFRDDPERAWGAGTEPWYDLLLATSEKLADPEVRTRVLAGPDGGLPPVPIDGSAEAFDLVGRVIGHYRPRRCPGYLPVAKVLPLIEQWAAGKISLADLIVGAYDPLLLQAAGSQLGEWLGELFEGRINPAEKRERPAAEVAVVTTRLLNLAEWLSAGALDGPRSAPGRDYQ